MDAMPIFRYECRKCRREFELLLPRFDAEARCPECGSDDLKRAPNRIGAIGRAAPASCAARHECPAAGSHSCGCGCGCHHGK